MNATLKTPVRIVTSIPGGEDVTNTLGTLCVDVVGGQVDQGQLCEQLATMLTAAGAYLAETGTFPPDPTPAPLGEGESASLG